MAYKIRRIDGAVLAVDAGTLQEARDLVGADLSRHPGILTAPFGGSPGIRWGWNIDDLEARNGATGAVLYTIRVIPDP